jgi:eukaryotic-like serine/threonine-protein kinase
MSANDPPERRTQTIAARRFASRSARSETVTHVAPAGSFGAPPEIESLGPVESDAGLGSLGATGTRGGDGGSGAQTNAAGSGDGGDPEAVFAGYELRELLGRGGMGEVLLAHDELIGREVAIKRMRRRDPTPDSETRFLREAKIQARLQHPAIVPVHELGRAADGRPYFTMKRLAGETLEELRGEPLQRLLRAFADVCLAIEFAHEHGVIHRDIKPTNIMLGDFGEVYVLDWGVARVLDDESAKPSVRDIAALEGETQVGSVMGTPGYMAPEQALGYAMTPAIDIYALGCVLFEILTCEPLHPRGAGGAASAIARPTEVPSARRPDLAIPPELDAACVAALAEDPVARPSARELARRIQDYLDGDRDLERRRELAAAQVERAREALASGDPARRAEAVHAAGRALALDPESAEAAELVTSLIVEPPRVLPPELVASLAGADRDAHRARMKTAIRAFLALMALGLAVPFVEVQSWPVVIGFLAAMAGMMGISWLSYRRGSPVVWLSLVAPLVVTLLISRVAGPFVLTPVLACGFVLGLSGTPALLARPALVLGWIALSVIAPVALEAAGVLTPTTWFEGDTLVIHSAVIRGTAQVKTIAVIAVQIGLLALAALYARATSRERREAEQRMHIQAWHLRQLLPCYRR